jgi:integrase
MKKEYPTYQLGDTNKLEKNLKGGDKLIFESFMTFVSASAGKLKQKERRLDILQIHDIIRKPFNTWTYEDIVGFVALMRESDRAIWTKKGTLTTLSIFLKWKFRDWSLRFNELDIVKKLQRQLQPDNSKRYNEDTLLTAEELDRLIRSADKLIYKLWISMCGEAGLPYAVQSKITWNDLKIDDLQDGITTLSYYREKNKNPFKFPLGKVTTYYLKQWKQEYPYPGVKKDDLVFPSPTTRDTPVRQPTIHTMLNTVSKKSGVNKQLYQYLIRHSVLSANYQKNGMTEEVHRRLFGHKPGSKMTRIYSHPKDEDVLRNALELLHKVQPLTHKERNKIKELEISLKQQQQKIDSLLQFESRAIKIEKANARVLNKLIQLASQGKISDKEFIELMDIYKK